LIGMEIKSVLFYSHSSLVCPIECRSSFLTGSFKAACQL
jgi:hypothetical protein